MEDLGIKHLRWTLEGAEEAAHPVLVLCGVNFVLFAGILCKVSESVDIVITNCNTKIIH